MTENENNLLNNNELPTEPPVAEDYGVTSSLKAQTEAEAEVEITQPVEDDAESAPTARWVISSNTTTEAFAKRAISAGKASFWRMPGIPA